MLTRVKARSRRVTDLASMLNKLACQTNLLALNAAAERGEHELARRMRELALRSAAAAGEIGDLAGQSIAEVEAGDVAQMQVAQLQVAAPGGAQVITPFEQMSRDSCALVQEAAASARGLQDQAMALSRAVASFKLEEGAAAVAAGADADTAPEPAPTDDATPTDALALASRSHLRLASGTASTRL